MANTRLERILAKRDEDARRALIRRKMSILIHLVRTRKTSLFEVVNATLHLIEVCGETRGGGGGG